MCPLPIVPSSGWQTGCSDLAPEQAAAVHGLCTRFPLTRTILQGIAEASPYLFDLIRADAARLIRLLECEPDRHLAALIERTCREVTAAAGEADVMQLLRHMKSEAALLIALADIGGVWPVMQVTAALTDLAVASVRAALRFVLRQEAARGRLSPPNPDAPEDNSGLVVLAMGKMGAGELNYSSDVDLIVFFDPAAPTLAPDLEPAPFFVRVTQAMTRLLQQRHRRRLRVPGRSAAAACSPSEEAARQAVQVRRHRSEELRLLRLGADGLEVGRQVRRAPPCSSPRTVLRSPRPICASGTWSSSTARSPTTSGSTQATATSSTHPNRARRSATSR